MPNQQQMKKFTKRAAALILMGAAIAIAGSFIPEVKANELMIALIAGQYAHNWVYKMISKLPGLK